MKIIKLQRFRHVRYKRGQTVIISVIFLLFVSLSLIFGISNSVVREFKITQDVVKSTQSYFTAESGNEDVTYRIKNGKTVGTTESLSLNGATTNTTISDIVGGKEILSSSNFDNLIRKVKTQLTTSSSGVNFNYGVQVGDGGLKLENQVTINGNVFSNGKIVGNSEGGSSNIIKGNVISAGSTGTVDGLISGIRATSSVYAHKIANSIIDKDAYYQNISNTTVGGVQYPGSSDLPKANLPIPDSLIAQWESEAEAGGVINCGSSDTYEISSSGSTIIPIGPKKIPCNLVIKNTARLRINGPLWVTGNIDVKETVNLYPSDIGGKSILIADNLSNRLTSSKIKIYNNARFRGNVNTGPYVLLVSQNSRAETSGDDDDDNPAIEVKNNVKDFLLYAAHGKILISGDSEGLNPSSLIEVSGYKITAKKTIITYSNGLANPLFSSGPSGSYEINGWREIK